MPKKAVLLYLSVGSNVSLANMDSLLRISAQVVPFASITEMPL